MCQRLYHVLIRKRTNEAKAKKQPLKMPSTLTPVYNVRHRNLNTEQHDTKKIPGLRWFISIEVI